jgi:hypothetical protein
MSLKFLWQAIRLKIQNGFQQETGLPMFLSTNQAE